jgi:polyisoprenoid-binding protein YceI
MIVSDVSIVARIRGASRIAAATSFLHGDVAAAAKWRTCCVPARPARRALVPIIVALQPSATPDFRPIAVVQTPALMSTEVVVMPNMTGWQGRSRPSGSRHPRNMRLRGGLLAAAVLAAGAGAAISAQSWRIDEAHTSIGFKIDAVGFPTTRGRFTRYTGDISIDFDRPSKSFTRFTVESDSVDVGSASYTDFVKSPALLNVAQYPTMSFASTAVEKLDGRTARVTGDLTLLGVTRPVALTVNVDDGRAARGLEKRVDKGANAVAFSATGTIRRSEFGMVFGLPLVDDALEITVKTRALTDE